MISSLQPNRPRLSPPSFSPSINYQQTRPKTQMEAMPPHPRTTSNQACLRESKLVMDASVLHPVFFTERLKKAPAGVRSGNGAWGSPVCEGYVWNDGVRRDGDARL